MKRSMITSIQIGFRQIREAREDTGGRRTALLSQEGSTIETAVEIVRGVVPEPYSLRTHFEAFRLGNHPSRHRKKRDDAALLTQEGSSSPEFAVTDIPSGKFIMDGRGL